VLPLEQAWESAGEIYGNVSKSTELFILLKAAKDKSEPLDIESEKLLNRMLLRYTQRGHGFLQDTDIQQWSETQGDFSSLYGVQSESKGVRPEVMVYG
jgi:metallopeptidase MepB